LVLIAVASVACDAQDFLGIYRNDIMETWHIYEDADGVSMANYTSSPFGGETYSVDVETISSGEIVLLTGTATKFILDHQDGAWYLSEQFPNGRILKPREYRQVSGPVSQEVVEEYRTESLLYTTISISSRGYYFGNTRKLYFVYPQYTRLSIFCYPLSSEFQILEGIEHVVFFQDDAPFVEIDGQTVPFKRFVSGLHRWGHHREPMYEVSDVIANALFTIDRIEVLRSIGVEPEFIESIGNTILVVTDLGNLILDRDTYAIVDSVPRHGDGVDRTERTVFDEQIDMVSLPSEVRIMMEIKAGWIDSDRDDIDFMSYLYFSRID